jgi:hypothetical protein
MLGYLHNGGHLIKVKTNLVNMTPDSQTVIGLDELNKIIAEQKGITLEQLAVSDGSKIPVAKKTSKIVDDYVNPEGATVTQSTTGDFDLSPSELRSRADALFKQAQVLRKKADELDPPKKKSKEAKVIAE